MKLRSMIVISRELIFAETRDSKIPGSQKFNSHKVFISSIKRPPSFNRLSCAHLKTTFYYNKSGSTNFLSYPMGEITKKQSEGVRFC